MFKRREAISYILGVLVAENETLTYRLTDELELEPREDLQSD